MSDTILNFIPVDPSFVPDESRQQAAYEAVCAAFPDAQVERSTTPDVCFVDPGQNFETVFCNLCGQQIELGDWEDAMDAASATQFENLDFGTPCCSSVTSLNALRYEWPAGFAKFRLAVQNPQSDLSEQILEEVRHMLGTQVRVIWAHY